MEIEKFVQNFGALFEETDINTFTKDTKFCELDEWTSLMALSTIAMVDEEYGVKVKGADIRSSVTVEDLYNIVKSRI